MTEYTPEHRADEDPVIGDAPPQANTLLSNRVYDKLRFLAVILLPALGTLYFGLAGIWGLPNADEVVGTIVVVDTFLGVVLQLSKKQYDNSDAKYDGEIVLTPALTEDGDPATDLSVALSPVALGTKDEVLVKVHKK